jgi:beta-lactamase class A
MIALFLAAALQSGDGLQPVPARAQARAHIGGYAAINLDTGKRVALNGDERFPMASVFKVPAAIALLQRVDRGEFRLDQKVTITPAEFSRGWSPIRDAANGQTVTMSLREMLVFLLSVSDNTAVDKAFTMMGGPVEVTKALRKLGIEGIRVDRKENEVGRDAVADPDAYARDPRDTATPNAMADLLRLIYRRKVKLSPSSHALMMSLMELSPTGPRRLRETFAGSIVAHKTGNMPGTANDVGIVTTIDGKHHLAIAIFTKASKMSEDERDAAIRELASDAAAAVGFPAAAAPARSSP